MPRDATGRKGEPIATDNDITAASTDSLCYLVFSSHKGLSITLITLLLFYANTFSSAIINSFIFNKSTMSITVFLCTFADVFTCVWFNDIASHAAHNS